MGQSVWCRLRYRQREYASGGVVIKSADGPPIAHSHERADEGKRLAGRGLRRALRMIQEGVKS